MHCLHAVDGWILTMQSISGMQPSVPMPCIPAYILGVLIYNVHGLKHVN